MDNFTFYNPTRIIFGKETVGQIGGVIKEAGLSRVLLVAGGGSIKKNGVYDTVARSLREAGVDWVEAWGVRPNPVLTKAREIIDAGQERAGGRGAGRGRRQRHRHRQVRGRRGVFAGHLGGVRAPGGGHPGPAHFCGADHERHGERDGPPGGVDPRRGGQEVGAPEPGAFPGTAIIDPTVQYSLPWHQTVNGAIDALTHVMEFYFLGTWEETTLALDEALMRTIISMTHQLQQNPRSYEARANLAWAASLALNGLTGVGLREGDFATHRIETAMSAVFPEIAHGAGLGVLFPAWILYMKDYNAPTFARWAKNIWGADSVEAGVARMRQTFQGWDAPITLGELGVSEADIPAIVDAALKVGVLGKLKELTGEDIAAILRLAL